LLAVPLNILILEALAGGSMKQGELRYACDSPPRGALRSQLKALTAAGAIVKRRRGAFGGASEYVLAEPGRELGFVKSMVVRWLAEFPPERRELDSDIGRAALEALVDGWSSSLIWALAGRPLALAELDALIADRSRLALERTLRAMRATGLAESLRGDSRNAPHTPTDWMRLGIAPIIAASRWERRNAADWTARIARIDAETALRLSAEVIRMPPELSGSCRLVVEVANGDVKEPAAVTIDIGRERAVPVAPIEGAEDDAWIVGSPDAWFRAAIESKPGHLEVGGHSRLAQGYLGCLNTTLFAPYIRSIWRIPNRN
jgi:DNA-binding HxlR family transcriptional regulator